MFGRKTITKTKTKNLTKTKTITKTCLKEDGNLENKTLWL